MASLLLNALGPPGCFLMVSEPSRESSSVAYITRSPPSPKRSSSTDENSQPAKTSPQFNNSRRGSQSSCGDDGSAFNKHDEESSIIGEFLASLEGQGIEDKESPLLQYPRSLAPAPLVATQRNKDQLMDTHTHDDGTETQLSPQQHGSKKWINREPLHSLEASIFMFNDAHASTMTKLQLRQSSTKVSLNFFMHKVFPLHDMDHKVSSLSIMHPKFKTIYMPVEFELFCTCWLTFKLKFTYFHIHLSNAMLLEQSSFFMIPTPYEVSSYNGQIAYTPTHALTNYMPTLHTSMFDSMHVFTQSNAMLMNLHAYTLIQCIFSTIHHTINHREMSQMLKEPFIHAYNAFHPIFDKSHIHAHKVLDQAHHVSTFDKMQSSMHQASYGTTSPCIFPKQPLQNPTPNHSNGGVLTIFILYIGNLKFMDTPKLMTIASILPKGWGKHYEDQAKVQQGDANYNSNTRLKDGVDAALSKVKMKTFTLIIYGVTITLDPG